MRTIEWTTKFHKDYKRESRGLHRAALDSALSAVVQLLATDQALQPRQRDHDLIGDHAGCRECHIRPDLLLIYRKLDDANSSGKDKAQSGILRLVRLGSHSELFG